MSKLELFYPLNPYGLNQPFGVNGAYYQANGINIKGHNGLDLWAYHGQPVYAAHAGTAYYETDAKGGHGVVIVTDIPFEFQGKEVYFKSIYWHFAEPSDTYPQLIKNGQKVKAGDQIGWADTTGLSSGDHTHFGLKPVVKGNHISSNDAPDSVGNYTNVVPDNGYLGAIDPAPYFNRIYATDAQKVISLYQQVLILLLKLQGKQR